jgi:hypothetical protein
MSVVASLPMSLGPLPAGHIAKSLTVGQATGPPSDPPLLPPPELEDAPPELEPPELPPEPDDAPPELEPPELPPELVEGFPELELPPLPDVGPSMPTEPASPFSCEDWHPAAATAAASRQDVAHAAHRNVL